MKLRKQDIVRRRALQRKAFEHREDMIVKEAKRQERMKEDLGEAEFKFNDDHREEIEAYYSYQQ